MMFIPNFLNVEINWQIKNGIFLLDLHAENDITSEIIFQETQFYSSLLFAANYVRNTGAIPFSWRQVYWVLLSSLGRISGWTCTFPNTADA